MRQTRTFTLVMFALAILLPRPAHAAANKEHLQLMAEIRMLQEQQQQLQAMLGTLADAVKAVSTKLDEQSAATRKAMADQTLAINGLGDNMRVVREKVDDTNVRIATMSQEIDALRQVMASAPAAAPVAATSAGEPGGAAQPTGGGTPPPVMTPSANPVGIGQSPQRAYDASFDDYTAGRYELAITGFDSYIKQFPKSPNAASAQFYIGQSYFAQSKWPDARDAFQRVTSDFGQSPIVADAYYKLGQTYERLNQVDLAKKAYETVTANYSTASVAILAKQSLDRLNRK